MDSFELSLIQALGSKEVAILKLQEEVRQYQAELARVYEENNKLKNPEEETQDGTED